MNKKQEIRIGKIIAYLLRHDPQDLEMDESGWVLISDLIKKLNISEDDLDQIVINNNKKRYTYDTEKKYIRANQGHSIQGVTIEMDEVEPPVHLYHGTTPYNKEAIRESGLLKMNRQHVHLSRDTKTAVNVGRRHTNGQRVLLITVDALKMYNDGYKFFQSKNGVWLTDKVPPQYTSLKR